MYGACGLGAKIGGGLVKKLYKLIGPIGWILNKAQFPLAVVKLVQLKFCPKASVVAGGIASGLIPIPGV